MPTQVVNGYHIYYEDDDFTDPWQSSEVLFIQHGFGRNSQFWSHWVPAFARDYRVIRVDLRGHGRSGDPGPDHLWSFDEMISDMAGLLDILKIERINLLAESTGGMIGAGFAALHPERLQSLILCASPTTVGAAASQRFAAGRSDWKTALREMGSEGWARWLLEARVVPAGGKAQVEWAIQEWALSKWYNLAGYSDVITGTDVEALLPKITAPVLLLAPQHSQSATPESQERIAQVVPNARIAWINGSGHEIYIDQADACIAATRNFLNEVPISHA